MSLRKAASRDGGALPTQAQEGLLRGGRMNWFLNGEQELSIQNIEGQDILVSAEIETKVQ